MKILTAEQIVKLSENKRQVNEMYYKQDDSNLWPISGKFNVTKRAIGKIKRAERQGLVFDDLLSYALTLEAEISEIVNNERNW
jgi:predicted DNA-binding protein YlxM (UPF0122 family)